LLLHHVVCQQKTGRALPAPPAATHRRRGVRKKRSGWRLRF